MMCILTNIICWDKVVIIQNSWSETAISFENLRQNKRKSRTNMWACTCNYICVYITWLFMTYVHTIYNMLCILYVGHIHYTTYICFMYIFIQWVLKGYCCFLCLFCFRDIFSLSSSGYPTPLYLAQATLKQIIACSLDFYMLKLKMWAIHNLLLNQIISSSFHKPVLIYITT